MGFAAFPNPILFCIFGQLNLICDSIWFMGDNASFLPALQLLIQSWQVLEASSIVWSS